MSKLVFNEALEAADVAKHRGSNGETARADERRVSIDLDNIRV